ncbi:MarR family transcriptional regulator [Alkalihalophilus pseudofirmus]|uniref:MarR family winged helix-turn-helix transcriptional regulator n=1 Tax=Alkalihalobacterium alkalinitrilicum TaxID=427920 RepID=UPI00094D1684|nr:MarR family transcriptional regulator [Alkalihalobacterium alkalinitrilicum]OLO39058.1 MarR family transcriptional regulator [Alkalihalophilus pseudofirmus]
MNNEQIKEQDQELSLKSFIVLSRAHRAVSDRVEEDIRRYGLNPTEFAVLELLYHKGDQPIQQIGKKVLLASGSITYVVDKLEKKNLLVRRSCPKDRRVTHAAITEDGIDLMNKIFPTHKEAIEKIFSSLSSDEKLTMINLLKKLGTNA